MRRPRSIAPAGLVLHRKSTSRARPVRAGFRAIAVFPTKEALPSPETPVNASSPPIPPAAGNGAGDRAAVPCIADLVERLGQAGEAPVLRHRGRDVAAADSLQAIFRYGRALDAIGIGRGSLVAMFAPNCPDALAIRYATNLIGAGAAYLSVPSSPRSRAELLAQIAPDLLVLFAETADLLTEGGTARLASVGTGLGPPALRLDQRAAEQPGSPLPSRARPGDLAVVISSGGTTGVPKGSWRDFAAYTAMVRVASSADRRQLVNGRLAYLSQALVDATLLGGGSVVLEDSYDPARTLATIEAERITDLFLVEPQLFEVMDHPDVARRNLSSLRAVNHIGASAPPTLRRRARERLGAVVGHTYRASEIGLVSILAPAEHDPKRPDLFGCAGRILRGVDVRFRRDDGSLAGPSETGSIEVRSPAMAGGYRHRPDLQAAAFQDGWYKTGDLGRLDAEGYLHILGRAADIAWIDGAMVSPTLIEDTLCQVSAVRYAVVVVDQEAGSWIAAVVPWPGSAVDPQACLQAIARRHRAAAAAPVLVLPMERVPLTEQGKPDRVAIRQAGRQARAPAPGAG
jgi:fatty-acyl-CoA synthase